jgi:Restriction endonuclease
LVSNLLFTRAMGAIRQFPFLHFAFAFALATTASHALQLGESEAQITTRHGAPAVEDHGRRLAMYFWEGWSAQIEFKDGLVGRLTYRSNSYLKDSDIQSLLQANGGVDRWRETTSLATKAPRWVRDDGAVATGDAARPTGMSFQAVGVSADGVTPAEAIVSDSFLKFDASAPMPVPQPDSPLSEPAVRSNAPAPRLRSEPELRSDEVASGSTPAVEELPQPAAATEPVAAAIPVAPEVAASSGFARVIGGVILGLSVIGTALLFFLWKRKPACANAPAPSVSSPAPSPEIAEPIAAAGDAADLTSIRGDQIELLLGEIFRRQGYTVELSAALSADGASDLTLRRDGESIPVQSKDWKTARVTEREVREFYGLMAGTAAPRGVFVTTGSFSRDARDFAADKAIDLIDRSTLDQRIADVRRPEENFFEVQSWIDDFTAQARIFDPECPICRGTMSIRQNRSSGAAFWACTGSARCAGRREPRGDLLTAAAAA